MKTLQEVLDLLERRIDRQILESYIAQGWLRPLQQEQEWRFEEIDIARLQLITHLRQDINVNDEGMDVVLSLLDQLYELRTQMQHFTHAITLQPQQTQTEIMTIIKKLTSHEHN